MRKIAIICSPGNDNHLSEVADHFKSNYETKICVTSDLETIFNAVKWADVIWIEWADNSAIHVTRFDRLLYQKQVILRLHSYEAFTPYLDYIKWHAITDLIFVAEHIKDIVLKKYPCIEKNVDRIHVIPNGIDTDKFGLSRKENGKDLAYLGFINFKKGPLLLFSAFAELVARDPRFNLHIAGTFQEERYALYLKQMKKQNELFKDRIQFYGWAEKPEEWLKDKSHIICTSVLESQGKGIMEAMAMGLKPVIHNFVGAESIYPKKYLWNTPSEFCDMVLSEEYEPEEYRKFILDNYNTKNIIKQLDEVLSVHPDPVSVFVSDELAKPITLSVSMIMRDEEKNIGRCLESIKDIADEIVIVDTGSTDRSIEIAKSYGAKVYEHPWENDFSLHRNQALMYSTGDWSLHIDADEELTGNKEGLKKTLGKLSPEYNGVSVKLRDASEVSGTQFNASRIFRKGKVKYRRAVHNIPIYEGAETFGAVLYDDVTIVHHGSHYNISKEESKKKTERTGSLLLKALKDDPEDYELYFYLMQFYGTVEDYEKAIFYGEKYLESKNLCNGFNESVYYTIVRMHLEQKNYDKAYQWLIEAQRVLPDDLDIAFVATELGAVTGNGSLLLQGARKYLQQYEVFTKRSDAKGGRFVFTLRPFNLYFVLKHMTSYLLTDGVGCLSKLKESIGFLQEEDRKLAVEEVQQILEPIGVSTN